MSAVKELTSILGDSWVREAEETDAVDGVRARYVASPATLEETSAVMAHASSQGWSVAPRGGRTSLSLGNPPARVDLILDLTRMDRVLEHSSGDLVASMEAGARLSKVQEELGRAGQMLALDGYPEEATIGGLIATNTSGPRRFRYGTIRDLLIGITIVLPDGTIAKAGGKVVKNVAGYDLAKLMTGSLGTLGVIGRAIFRLHPKPKAQRLVLAEVDSPDVVASLVQKAIHSTLTPTALQLSWPLGGTGQLGLLLESIEPSVVAQAAAARSLFDASAKVSLVDADVPAAWTRFTERAQSPMEVKITCLPSALGDVITAVRRAAGTHGGTAHLSGPVGNGVLHLHLDETDADRAGVLTRALRSAVKPGHVVVLRAPTDVKREVDVWGPLGDTEPIMRRVKERFDPQQILNPGRFVGGI